MNTKTPILTHAMTYAEMMEACAAYVAVKRPKLREPLGVYRLLAPLCKESAQESFFVILLNTKSNVIGTPTEVTRGLLDACPVHPREVFRQAVAASAAAVILAHNHPSGDPTPSREDIEVTRRLIDAGQILGIPVFDHVVLGTAGAGDDTAAYVSLRERNLVNFTAKAK